MNNENLPQMSITEKVKVAVNSIPIEWMIICGVIFIICGIIYVIYRSCNGMPNDTVVNKLLDHLNTLEGALIVWGTSIIGAITSKMKNGNDK